MDRGVTCKHLNKLTSVLEKEQFHSKECLTCIDCGSPGPNLWVCLQPSCHHLGCSEGKNDHSTLHFKKNFQHCIHMNVSTERIWCYVCEHEVHARAAIAYARANQDSIALGGSSASPPHIDIDLLTPDSSDQIEETEAAEQDESQLGLVGLQNMGNTCYMNAALQALSNTVPLTNYFLECAAIVNLLTVDKKPALSRSYQKLIRDMWNNKSRCFITPNAILYGIRNVHPMFRGYHQHDTQEFLRCFMDQLHEELKEAAWETFSEEQKINSEADGDHHKEEHVLCRRRAASSGASDAPLFVRIRRKSPAPSAMSDTRTDGYLRVQTKSECFNSESARSHRRSASFAGTQHAAFSIHSAHYHAPDSTQKDTESELSSEGDDPYETCSSGASDVHERSPSPKDSNGSGDSNSDSTSDRCRSVISDVFDGKLLSSVQCLICDRVSTRMETFQDLSLPIPSREHLALLRLQHPVLNHVLPHQTPDSWTWWVISWLRSWFYGPVISLQDCLAAFFSADELKGDNMYSCSRCNTLRNGVKMSGVLRLPEILCVHLKRFRHELMFSSKVAARVAFPLHDLNMAPYLHKDCTSKVTKYELSAVICHSGTAGGGHYTCIARNGRNWYEFDDQCVTPVTSATVAQSEAYVLFYRKVNPNMAAIRLKAASIMDTALIQQNDVRYYISKQWINKFNTWAEPGPIDNVDMVCSHGNIRPDRANFINALSVCVPQELWDYLYNIFGGGPTCTTTYECAVCARAAQLLLERRATELRSFYELHAAFQEQQTAAIFAISMAWFRQWQNFVRANRPQPPPPPVDNMPIVTMQEIDGIKLYSLKPESDYAQLSEELWRFFTSIYGGGPEIKLRSAIYPQSYTPEPVHYNEAQHLRKYSESDKEDYPKSTSDTNINESVYREIVKNQSLQNIRRQDESGDEYQSFKKHEQNGNCHEMEVEEKVARLENGFDSSDHDANDNLVKKVNSDPQPEVELPNLDSISLKKSKGKVRKVKRRTVK